MNAKDDLAAEGKRQLGNTLWSYEQSLGERENYLVLARKDVAPRRLLDIFWSTASSLLKIGQGRARAPSVSPSSRKFFRAARATTQ